MSMDEFAGVMEIMQSLYPNVNVLGNPTVTTFWYNSLKNIPAEDALAFLAEWGIESTRFAPNIANFIEHYAKSCTPDYKDAMEAWGDVMKSIRCYGYPRETEAMASLDEITRSVVRDMGYKNICMGEEVDQPILFAQFRNAYEARVKRKERENITAARLGMNQQDQIERRD